MKEALFDLFWDESLSRIDLPVALSSVEADRTFAFDSQTSLPSTTSTLPRRKDLISSRSQLTCV
jgi:hypothetical protein